MPVSDVLAAALLQRMRRLNRAERAVLMRASVIGRRFRVAVLAVTAAMTEDRVRGILEKACVLQFLVRETSDGDWYAFRHALICDVAYQEFVATRVRAVHRRIANAMERCARPDENALDDLAYHSWAAADAARCRRYNERAGDRAAAAFAHHDAHTYYARAREFVEPDSAQHRRLTRKIAAAHGDASLPGRDTPKR